MKARARCRATSSPMISSVCSPASDGSSRTASACCCLAYYGAFSREQLSVKLDMPVNLLRASLRRSLVEVEQCLKS